MRLEERDLLLNPKHLPLYSERDSSLKLYADEPPDWMRRGEAARVDLVEGLHDGENGAMRVWFDERHAAQFKPCNRPHWPESYANELIAYALDRVFAIGRVPNVVVRYFDGAALCAKAPATCDVLETCDSRGSLMLWDFARPLRTVYDYDRVLLRRHAFDGSAAPALVEFARLLIALILNGAIRKLGHNTMVGMRSGALVHLDNDRSDYKTAFAAVGGGSGCNRSTRTPNAPFMCALRRRTARDALQLLASACVFPRHPALRLRAMANDGRGATARAARAMLGQARLPAHAATHMWRSRVVDERVSRLSAVIERCLVRFKHREEHVLV